MAVEAIEAIEAITTAAIQVAAARPYFEDHRWLRELAVVHESPRCAIEHYSVTCGHLKEVTIEVTSIAYRNHAESWQGEISAFSSCGYRSHLSITAMHRRQPSA